jgi:hypothetical protein
LHDPAVRLSLAQDKGSWGRLVEGPGTAVLLAATHAVSLCPRKRERR